MFFDVSDLVLSAVCLFLLFFLLRSFSLSFFWKYSRLEYVTGVFSRCFFFGDGNVRLRWVGEVAEIAEGRRGEEYS